MKVHNLSSTRAPCAGEAKTEGLFSGSLEVVIRTDGRHWNPLMAATPVPKNQLRPRQLEQPRNHRDHVAFTAAAVQIKQTDLITGSLFFTPDADASVFPSTSRVRVKSLEGGEDEDRSEGRKTKKKQMKLRAEKCSAKEHDATDVATLQVAGLKRLIYGRPRLRSLKFKQRLPGKQAQRIPRRHFPNDESLLEPPKTLQEFARDCLPSGLPYCKSPRGFHRASG